MLQKQPGFVIKTLLFAVLMIGSLTISDVYALSETDFLTVGSRYGISPYLLLAISIVESQQGELMGTQEVQNVVNKTQQKFLRKIARHTGRELSEFKGSHAGAMGYMQIMPSTFYMYGQDGNGDGIKDPLNEHDNLATAAFYLAYRIATNETLTDAIKNYNNSTEYCQKVMALSRELELDSTLAARK